jgi:hypothetical protein
MEANREHKDSVFTRYFQEKSRLIELYNAITNANYPADADIQINTLEDILFMGRRNDISFLLDDTLVILVEHQSTINLNMPLRFLLFIARIYERLLDAANLYKIRRVDIPRPEFIVLSHSAEYPSLFGSKRNDVASSFGGGFNGAECDRASGGCVRRPDEEGCAARNWPPPRNTPDGVLK